MGVAFKLDTIALMERLPYFALSSIASNEILGFELYLFAIFRSQFDVDWAIWILLVNPSVLEGPWSQHFKTVYLVGRSGKDTLYETLANTKAEQEC